MKFILFVRNRIQCRTASGNIDQLNDEYNGVEIFTKAAHSDDHAVYICSIVELEKG